MGSDNESINELSLNIPFESPESALVAYKVLSIDKELKGQQLKRTIHADGNHLSVTFFSSDLKLLRVAVNSLLKNIILVVKTMKQFGQS